MKATEFTEIVSHVSFFPGWELSVSHDKRVDPPTRIKLVARWRGLDTDRHLAADGYPEERDLERVEIRDIRNVESADDVYRTLVEFLGRIWLHEAREALRIPDDDWRAPFHPHREDTHERFLATTDKSVALEPMLALGR